jgi:type IV secretion system protein VirD4
MDTKLSPKQIAIGTGLVVLVALALMGVRVDLLITRSLSVAMAGALGYGAGWLFSPGAKKLRGALKWIAFGFVIFLLVVAGNRAGTKLSALLSLIAFIVGLAYWFGAAMRGIREKPTTFGSAEWAKPEYLRANRLIGETGLRLGAVPDAKESLRLHYEGDRHLLTIAPTRAGKGVSAIVPNLLTYSGSALVIDPKGENAMITSAARSAMGQEIHVVDPWLIAPNASTLPSRFNPLDWLEPGDIDMTENAMLLADALVMPQSGGDRFWTEEAKALLQGLILYVVTDEYEREERHLGRVRDLLLLDGENMPRLFQRMANSPHHIVASTGARCLQKEERLLANVIASAQAETHFLDSARIRESLSASDFKFEDLKARQMTIYLVLPSDRLNAFGRWLRLLIQQAITVNARNIETKPAKPILFLLDEMPALGRLSMLEQAFGLMAGFGMQLWGIVQDVSQLKRIYGDGWETFIGNSGVVQYFGSRDRMTAEYFSALCGTTTVWNLSTAVSQAFNKGGSQTLTASAAQRKLAFPDELMRLASDKQLVLIENHHPIVATKTRWFEDAALKALGRSLGANDNLMPEISHVQRFDVKLLKGRRAQGEE